MRLSRLELAFVLCESGVCPLSLRRTAYCLHVVLSINVVLIAHDTVGALYCIHYINLYNQGAK